MFAKDEPSGGYFVGTRLPTFKEEKEARDLGKRIKGMPERRGSEWDFYGMLFCCLLI